MEPLVKNGYPNYDHPLFNRANPCHDLYMDCEGDCAGCPNKEFFKEVDSVLPVPQT